MESRFKHSKRYYRHRIVKKEKKVRLDVRNRTMYCGVDFGMGESKSVQVLVSQYGYKLQTEAFFTPPPIKFNFFQ